MISSAVGRIFSTTNQGVNWFDIGDPGVFNNPGGFSVALAYGAPDPNAPEGIGNLGNFIYVGTRAGEIYITQDGGGSGTSNNWLNISLGLDGSPVQSIITNPVQGNHSAFAVTTSGIFYIKDSVLLGNNPTNAAFEWVNITSNIHNLPYTIFGQSYSPTTDPNSVRFNQAQNALSSIVADWRYTIPNSANDPNGPGFHPVLYVGVGNSGGNGSGVYQSIDDGLTWSLFPSTTFGAVTQGGYLPHVAVTSLSLSLGNIDPNTGMPNLAGPFDPINGTPTTTPDPDLLMASTYGQGQFAINLAPLVFPSTVKIDPNSNNNGVVNTATPTFDGLSAITAFGNATRITIFDVTDNKIVGGFDPSNLATNVAANWTDASGNFKITTYSGLRGFTTNGPKTVQIYATDDAGAVGNKVTLTFTLNATNLPPLPPTTPPTMVTLALRPSEGVLLNGVTYTKSSTPDFDGVTDTTVTSVELWQVINGAPTTKLATTTTIDPATGAFTLKLPSSPDGTYTVLARAINSLGHLDSTPVTFTIKTHGPTQAPTLSLDLTDDSGIVGDNITNVRKPHFKGTVGAANAAGTLVELFQADVNGNPTGPVLATGTPASNGTFLIQLQNPLVDGKTAVVAEAVDVVGNPAPGPSPEVTVTIVTVGSDYSGNLLDYNNTPIVFQAPASSVNQPITSATTTSLNSALSITSQNPNATVASLTVQLSLMHPNLADLSAVLIAPDGKTVVTLFGVGSLTGANLGGTIFSDSATANLTTGSAPYVGTFLTTDSKGLSQLAGQSINGTWTLRVTDNVTGNTGTLANWSLAITPRPVTTAQTFSSTTSSAIPGPSSSLLISGQGASTTVGNISVLLNVTYSSLGDLSAALIGPDGTAVTLFNAGDLSGANLVNTTFSLSATASLSTGTAPYTGTFKPSDAQGLAKLVGQSMNGTWKLQITDHATGKTGTLTGWSLTLTPQLVTAPQTFPLVPGSLIPASSSLNSPLTVTGQGPLETVGSLSLQLNISDFNLADLGMS